MTPDIAEYRRLVKAIADIYCDKAPLLSKKEDISHLSRDFHEELGTAALRWLTSNVRNNKDTVAEIVNQVNVINRELRIRFSNALLAGITYNVINNHCYYYVPGKTIVFTTLGTN